MAYWIFIFSTVSGEQFWTNQHVPSIRVWSNRSPLHPRFVNDFLDQCSMRGGYCHSNLPFKLPNMGFSSSKTGDRSHQQNALFLFPKRAGSIWESCTDWILHKNPRNLKLWRLRTGLSENRVPNYTSHYIHWLVIIFTIIEWPYLEVNHFWTNPNGNFLATYPISHRTSHRKYPSTPLRQHFFVESLDGFIPSRTIGKVFAVSSCS